MQPAVDGDTFEVVPQENRWGHKTLWVVFKSGKSYRADPAVAALWDAYQESQRQLAEAKAAAPAKRR